MWRYFAKQLDRLAIRSACGSVLPSPDGQSHAERAAEWLHRPDFFRPEVAAAPLQFTGTKSFEFPSAVRTGSGGENLVRGHCDLAAGDWRHRPSVILLHGWNAELQYEYQLPYWSRLLARQNVNGFRFDLPYHASRRPGAAEPIRNFFSGNLLHVARATHQAMADIRALALWLRAQGSPAVGLWGVSLGGWLGGMATAHQTEIDFAALLTPIVRMDRALSELEFCAAIRGQLRDLDRQFEALNLTLHRPACGPGNVLIVASDYDLFVPLDTINALETSWNQPEVWRLRHGHISILFSKRVMRRIANWLAAKAQRHAVLTSITGVTTVPACPNV